MRNTHNCSTIEGTVDVRAHGGAVAELHETWEGSDDGASVTTSDHRADHSPARVTEDCSFGNSQRIFDLVFIRVRYALIARLGLLQGFPGE